MTGFPLFHLPLLPLKAVFDEICLADLIRVHLCSKKTSELLKAIRKSVSFDSLSSNQIEELNALEILDLLRLETYNDPRGSFGCFPKESITITIMIGHRLEIKIDKNKRHDNKYQVCFPLLIQVVPMSHKIFYPEIKGSPLIEDVQVITKGKRELHSFWEDQCKGLNVLKDYFKMFFNSETSGYFIEGSDDPFFTRNLRIAFNGVSQNSIDNCVLQGSFVNKTEDYKLILDNVNPTICFEHFNPLTSLNDDFRHNTSFSSEYFKLSHANWFTLDNLIELDCQDIHLLGSNLTNADLKEYMKLWMTGKYSKLKRLTVELQEIVDLEYILSELETDSGDFICSDLLGYLQGQGCEIIREENTISIKNLGEIVIEISGLGNVFKLHISNNPMHFP